MDKNTLLKRESAALSDFAAKSDSAFLTQRNIQENDSNGLEIRLPYQRDRDRIIHSRAFRRLMHKTQVFNANKGDHYRNRLTHTLEVNQIARSIGKYLGLNDELVEAISLGHDLGHTPFGHIGERTLHLIVTGQATIGEDTVILNNIGGFKHNFQSLHLIDNLEKRTKDYKGLNLTLAVREGILKHTSMKIRIPEKIKNVSNKQDLKYSTIDLSNINIMLPSFTLEGQVVAIADEIAQVTHDLEDGIRAGIIKLDDIKRDELIQKICKDNNNVKLVLRGNLETVDIRNSLIKYMVGYLIDDVCSNSYSTLSRIENIPHFQNKNDVYKEQIINFSDEISILHKNLSNLITRLVIASQSVSQADSKAEYIITRIFRAYYIRPQQLPDYILKRYFDKNGLEFNRLYIEDNLVKLQNDLDFIRLICDHIASMTDQYASREYIKLYEPEYY